MNDDPVLDTSGRMRAPRGTRLWINGRRVRWWHRSKPLKSDEWYALNWSTHRHRWINLLFGYYCARCGQKRG